MKRFIYKSDCVRAKPVFSASTLFFLLYFLYFVATDNDDHDDLSYSFIHILKTASSVHLR